MKSLLEKPEIRAVIGTMYLADGLPPRMIQERLRVDHGIEVTGTSLRQWLVRTGLTKRRKAVDAELEVKLSPATVAKLRLEKAKGNLDRWADKSEGIVDKALDAATGSARLRDLAVATSTAAQALRVFQMCVGITPDQPAPRPTLNILNFARGPDSPFNPENMARWAAAKAAAAVKEQEAVEITAGPVVEPA